MRNYFYIACLLLSGCAAVPTYQTYSGPALPAEQVAFVKTESEHNNAVLAGLDHRLYIVEVDGVRPPTKSTTDVPYPESATVLPGIHTIKVLYERMGKWAIVSVRGDFQAARTYMIRQQPDSKLVRVWIEEWPSMKNIGESEANMGEQG